MNQRILFTTEARSLSGYQTPAEVESAEEIMSVALAQPHRQGDRDPRLESALGRLCKAKGWHSTSFDAGVMYGDNIRRMRLAEGFYVPCGGSTVYGEPVTEEDREKYRSRVRGANNELVLMHPVLPMLMANICYDGVDQDGSYGALIGRGLVKLAIRYEFRKFFHDVA